MDLPEVGLIIHYNLPTNIENYIHRSGRTARINKNGTSIAFTGPGDTKSLLEIEKNLHKKIPKLPVDQEKLLQSHEIVKIALKIAESEDFNTKSQKSATWESRASEAVGLGKFESSGNVGKKRIKIMKSILKQAKQEVEAPKKRGSVITPELYELAKKQKLV